MFRQNIVSSEKRRITKVFTYENFVDHRNNLNRVLKPFQWSYPCSNELSHIQHIESTNNIELEILKHGPVIRSEVYEILLGSIFLNLVKHAPNSELFEWQANTYIGYLLTNFIAMNKVRVVCANLLEHNESRICDLRQKILAIKERARSTVPREKLTGTAIFDFVDMQDHLEKLKKTKEHILTTQELHTENKILFKNTFYEIKAMMPERLTSQFRHDIDEYLDFDIISHTFIDLYYHEH